MNHSLPPKKEASKSATPPSGSTPPESPAPETKKEPKNSPSVSTTKKDLSPKASVKRSTPEGSDSPTSPKQPTPLSTPSTSKSSSPLETSPKDYIPKPTGPLNPASSKRKEAAAPPSATSTLNKPPVIQYTSPSALPKQPPVVSTKPTPAAPDTPHTPTAPDSPSTAPAKPPRLLSLDALRGFDMFWIVGGAALLRAIANWSGSEPFIEHATEQTKHTPWIGFTLYDLIFPLFIFMSGVTIPYSLTSKIANGTLSKTRAYLRVFRRFILLTALGLSFTFLSFDPDQFRIPGVLQLIAGGYTIAAILAIHRPARSLFTWALGILIGYWLALTFIPVPGIGAGQLTPGGNLAAYLDRLLPGSLYMGVFDPEGPVRYLPAAAMALLGAVTGSFLRSKEKATHATVFKLLFAGLVALGLGWAWGLIFPIIKPLWTSSYILVCAGCSLVLLSLFYLVIDVWKQRWLAFPWIPLGMNAITIYILAHFVSFRTISESILGGFAGTLAEHPGEFTLALGTIILEWIILFYLFRKKTFLRA